MSAWDEIARLCEDEGQLDEMPGSYTTAFAHPDGLDPNDAQRQRTQARAGNYPYDTPVSYGKPTAAGDDGSKYQVGGGNGPPPGEVQQEPDRPLSVWDRMSDITDGLDYEEGSGDREVSLSPVEVGPTGKGAASFGYGRYGMREVHEDLTLGGRDPFELEMDALRSDFRDSYRDTRHIVRRMRGPELVRLLMDLDPDYAAERFAPEADDDVADTYDCWALGLGGPEEET